MLKQSKGTKLKVVVAMVNEDRALRAAEDRVRKFLSWLRKVDATEITPRVFDLLKSVIDVIGSRFESKGR